MENMASLAAGSPEAVEQEKMSSEETPTPEEQQAFDKVETAAIAIAYDDKTHDSLVKMLTDGADDPAKTLAETAINIFGKIDEDSGGKIPEAVIFRGAEVCLDVVIELAEKANIMTVDENTAAQALQKLVIMVGDLYEIDPAELQAEIDAMDPGQVQQMVAEQEQIAGGAA